MHHKDQGADANHVVCPRKHHESNGGKVMYHHLREVLAFIVDGQRDD